MRRLRRSTPRLTQTSVLARPCLVVSDALFRLGSWCRRARAWPSPGRRRTPSWTTPTSRYAINAPPCVPLELFHIRNCRCALLVVTAATLERALSE
jgi:hypothetical protein